MSDSKEAIHRIADKRSRIRKRRNAMIVADDSRDDSSRLTYRLLEIVNERRLINAAATNNVDLVRKLLEEGTDPNACDNLQRTPLHISACVGYLDVIKCLVEFGANPNVRDVMNNTPLHLAACTCNVPVVIALLDAGTDVSSLNQLGMNPLQLAQSKLRHILQLPPVEEMEKLKSEIQLIGEMMHKALNIGVSEMDALNQRLQNLNTREEVDLEVQSLLNNLDSLSLNTK